MSLWWAPVSVASLRRQVAQLDGQLRITVIGTWPSFCWCPMSIRVIQGTMALKDIARGYDGLPRGFAPAGSAMQSALLDMARAP